MTGSVSGTDASPSNGRSASRNSSVKPCRSEVRGEPRLINCYPEAIGNEQRTPVQLLSIAGQKAFATIASGIPSRGMIYVKELATLFSIHGSVAYKVTSAGTATAIAGTIAGSNPVIMERGPARNMSATVEISIASPVSSRGPIIALQRARRSSSLPPAVCPRA